MEEAGDRVEDMNLEEAGEQVHDQDMEKAGTSSSSQADSETEDSAEDSKDSAIQVYIQKRIFHLVMNLIPTVGMMRNNNLKIYLILCHFPFIKTVPFPMVKQLPWY